jgi:hypothetical protein
MGGTRQIGRRALGLTAAIVLGLSLTACGGDDSDDDAAPTTEEASTDGGTTSDDDGDGMADVDEVPGLTGECEELVAAYIEASSGLGSVMSGGDTDFSEIAAYFSEVADNLPDEISDDFEVFGQAYAEFGQALEDAGIDLSDMSEADPEAMQALMPALEAFDDPAVQEASENISDWMDANCPTG